MGIFGTCLELTIGILIIIGAIGAFFSDPGFFIEGIFNFIGGLFMAFAQILMLIGPGILQAFGEFLSGLLKALAGAA